MKFSNIIRQHWAALRALLVLTVIVGGAYPLVIWLVAQFPGLRDGAGGSIVEAGGKPVGSSLIGQLFTDADGNPLPQYFQSRPSAAGGGYDPLATSASNLGPESIVDVPGDPALPADDNGSKTSLLSLVCSRSVAAGALDGVDGARPYCTGEGVGAVLSVIGPRDAKGNVIHPTRVVSVNEPCATTPTRSEVLLRQPVHKLQLRDRDSQYAIQHCSRRCLSRLRTFRSYWKTSEALGIAAARSDDSGAQPWCLLSKGPAAARGFSATASRAGGWVLSISHDKHRQSD